MEHLKAVLKEKGVPFEIIQHENTIRTAQEGADFFGIKIGQTAPTLILKGEQGFYALIFSGARRKVDFNEVSGILGCEQLRLADPGEVQDVTGYAVGSVSMAGLTLPCVVDRLLYQYPFIYGGTGMPGSTLKISPAALEKLNRVVAFLD